LTLTPDKKQCAGQPFLSGIKKLIDKVCFDSDAPRQHVGNKTVAEFVLGAEGRCTIKAGEFSIA